MSTPQNYEVQPLAWVVKPKGAELFADAVTRITREDEAAGQFLLISQDRSEAGQIAISSEEWPAIRQAIEAAFEAIRADEFGGFIALTDEITKENASAPPSAPPQAEPTGAELVGKLCWVWDHRTENGCKRRVTHVRKEQYRFGCDDGIYYRFAQEADEGVAP